MEGIERSRSARENRISSCTEHVQGGGGVHGVARLHGVLGQGVLWSGRAKVLRL